MNEDHKQALPPGFRLGAYRVARVLGVGGFGVTYLCEHTGLAVQVAVKEYLPNEIAVRDGTEVHPKSAGDREGFEWGLSRFLDEARTLARFEHPNVVRVRDCFEANNTAYIVMDYEDGEPLDALLRRHGTLTEAQLHRVLLPVVDGLRQVHAAGFLHRDIKPANIFVRRSDESPVLLDFGSARQALGRRSRSVTAIASAGYSPPEQYESDGHQGAWTDIYALSALCYRAITGDVPMEATRRQSQLLRTQTDPLPKLAEVGRKGYSPAFLEAVDRGLRVIEAERPQSLDEWLPRLEKPDALPARDSELAEASRPPSPATVRRVSERKAGGRADRVAWLEAGLLVIMLGLVWFAAQQGAEPHGDGSAVPSLVPSDGRGSRPLPEPPQAAFTVLVEPTDARVRILNIGPPYRPGMELAAGSYEVEASAPRYVTKTETVAHGAAPTVHRIALRQAGPKVGDRFRDCAECPEMVVVPAGSYRMGSPSYERGRQENEGPVHEVTIAVPFAIGRREVTVAEFGRFVDETGYSAGSSCLTYEGGSWGDHAGRGWRNPGFGQSGRHPVTCVSWDDAQEYAAWLSRETGEEYRLPSESEWEYAARAGTATARYWGEGESGQCRHANGADASSAPSRSGWWIMASCRDGHVHTAPAGSFGANGWGLHDVLGNVWEWTEDCWNDSYAGAPSDGGAWEYGDCSVRVLRGGAWYNGPSILRAAYRLADATGSRDVLDGFRVARTLAP